MLKHANIKSVSPRNETSAASKAAHIRATAKELAQENVESQQKGFQEWEVMADWGNRWLTMQPRFEVNQLRVFQRMAAQNLIKRAYKPVWWSPSTQTALAEAELEYKDDHVSQAVYLKMPIRIVHPDTLQRLRYYRMTLFACIWTTTPWTLPANRAIAVNENLTYVLVEASDKPDGSNYHLLVAEQRAQHVIDAVLRGKGKVLNIQIQGSELIDAEYADIMSQCVQTPQEIMAVRRQ